MTTSYGHGPDLNVISPEQCASFGLRPPIVVESESDGGQYIVKLSQPEGILSFGTGATVPEALRDLVAVMRSEAEALRLRRDRLSSGMARELAAIEAALAPLAPALIGPIGHRGKSPSEYVGIPWTTGATGPTANVPPATRSSSFPPLPSI